MDTKTRKQEALDLLALDTMTGKQRQEIDRLTAIQAGWSVKKARGGYYALIHPNGKNLGTHINEAEAWLWHRHDNDYSASVDACLTLLLPEYHEWRLYRHAIACIDLWMPGRVVETIEVGSADTFPLAMLRAWWQIQD